MFNNYMTECMKVNLNEMTPEMIAIESPDTATGYQPADAYRPNGWVANKNNPQMVLTLTDIDDSPKVYQVVMTVTNVQKVDAVLNDNNGDFVKSVTVSSYFI